MKTVNVGSGAITVDQFDTRSGTSFGHNAALGGLGVGAADSGIRPRSGGPRRSSRISLRPAASPSSLILPGTGSPRRSASSRTSRRPTAPTPPSLAAATRTGPVSRTLSGRPPRPRTPPATPRPRTTCGQSGCPVQLNCQLTMSTGNVCTNQVGIFVRAGILRGAPTRRYRRRGKG
jgi:hypothetical protein